MPVDPVELDEEKHVLRQRRALVNVRRLIDKLDYRDVLDRRKDKVFAIALGAVVLVAIAAMAIDSVMKAPSPEALERARCELDSKVSAVWRLKAQLRKSDPDMLSAEIDKRVAAHYRDMQSVAAIECAGGYKKGT